MSSPRPGRPTQRIKIDLRGLPPGYRYSIAILVVAVVVALAIIFRRPVPGWFPGVTPILGWIGVAALFYLALRRLFRRR